LHPIGGSAIVVGVGILWVEPDRLGVVPDGLVELAYASISDSPTGVGVGILWIEPDRLGVVADGIVERGFSVIGASAVVVRAPLVWVEADCLAEIAESLVEVTLVSSMSVCASSIAVGKGAVWIEPDSICKGADRFVVFLSVKKGNSAVDKSFCVACWRRSRSWQSRTGNPSAWRESTNGRDRPSTLEILEFPVILYST
jgi:hypothetical protein